MAATHEQDSTGSSTLPGGLVPAAIFCLAFGLRFAFLLQMRDTPMRDYAELPWQQWFIVDSAYYHQLGLSIAQGQFSAPTAHFLSPLYCYFVGLVYATLGVDLNGVRLAQCVIGSFSCVLLYWIGRQMFSEIVGILSGLCLAMYGLHIYYTEIILPTVLVVFLNLTFLLLLSTASSKLTPARAAGAGMILGLAALAKANSLLLVGVTIAVLWWQHREAGDRWFVRLAIPLAVGVFLTIAPVTVHNSAVSGEFVLITTTAGRNLMKGNGPTANGSHVQLPPTLSGSRVHLYLDGDVKAGHGAQQSREMVTLTLKHMASQPIASAKLFVKKAFLFVNKRELFIRDNFYFAKRYSSVLSLPLPGFALIGVLGLAGVLWSLRRWESTAHVYSMLLVQIVSYTLVFVLARYRLVAVACLILFASSFVSDVLQFVVERRRGALALAAAVALCCTLVVNIPFAEFPYERGFGEMSTRIERIQSERHGSNLSPP
ncbi:MAG: glycosyltransferase family 39 protein [Myxococcales bacterium]|nr:glycosyltransferase family 39 protein [Myxococcales bacterium]